MVIATDKFVAPIRPTEEGNAWDFHIYFTLDQIELAASLREQVINEFVSPGIKVYRLWDKPIGPHTLPMFEVDVFTTQDFGAFISWLVFNRRGLNVLVHPHTEKGNDLHDHQVSALWIGEKVDLNLDVLKRFHGSPPPPVAATTV
ncbi:hypothetical protein HK100_004703 [Physocladia obscura]|uniref:Uncharacterized protein n=1 Tax=Physocladia obscura TaxID=109957 RepID=A0AAD5SY47_9FUNG|nr:hypothetical protein HK100_004703 [Physocladia obscura]